MLKRRCKNCPSGIPKLISNVFFEIFPLGDPKGGTLDLLYLTCHCLLEGAEYKVTFSRLLYHKARPFYKQQSMFYNLKNASQKNNCVREKYNEEVKNKRIRFPLLFRLLDNSMLS